MLSVLSKTVTGVLPAILLVTVWYRRGRIKWKRDVTPLLPWILFGGGMGIVSVWMEHSLYGATGPQFSLSPIEKLLLACNVFWFYVGKLFCPLNLSFIYPKFEPSSHAFLQYAAMASLAGCLAILGSIARIFSIRGPLAGFLLYFGTMLPMLGFLNIAYFQHSYVADHFQYPALIAAIVSCTALLANQMRIASIQSKIAYTILCFTICGLLFNLTWKRCELFANSELLYRETLQQNPAAWVLLNN